VCGIPGIWLVERQAVATGDQHRSGNASLAPARKVTLYQDISLTVSAPAVDVYRDVRVHVENRRWASFLAFGTLSHYWILPVFHLIVASGLFGVTSLNPSTPEPRADAVRPAPSEITRFPDPRAESGCCAPGAVATRGTDSAEPLFAEGESPVHVYQKRRKAPRFIAGDIRRAARAAMCPARRQARRTYVCPMALPAV
jgi:hypothetical protein